MTETATVADGCVVVEGEAAGGSPGGVERLWWLVLVVPAAALALYVWNALVNVFCPYGLENGEGLMLRFCLLLADGEPLYRPLADGPPFVGCNYPPLFMLLTALPLKLFGPTFVPGRLISVLSALGTGAVIVRLCRRLGADWLSAWTGAGLFILVPTVSDFTVHHRVDPLSVFLAIAGIWLVMPAATGSADGESRPADGLMAREGVGLLLLALATFTKQTGVLACVAYLVWVVLWRRQRLVRTVLILGGLGAVLHGTVVVLTGGQYWAWVVSYSSGHYSGPRLLAGLNLLSRQALIVLAPALVLPALRSVLPSACRGGMGRYTSACRLFAIYGAVVLLSALLVARNGSSVVYFLELTAVAAVFAGMTVDAARRWAAGRPLRHVVSMAVLLALTAWHTGANRQFVMRLESPARQAELTRDPLVVSVMETFPSPMLSEDHAYVVRAGGDPYFVNPFIYADLERLGRWDPQPVLSDLVSGRISLVCLNSKASDPRGFTLDRFGARILAAVRMSYPYEFEVGDRYLHFRTERERDRAVRMALAAQQALAAHADSGR